MVEGNIRSTNTSPISDVEEQEEEVIIPSIHPQTDTQEKTLQPEFSEIEDTSIKKFNTQEDQNTGDVDERAVQDSIARQIEEEGTTPENDGDDYMSHDQDLVM